MAIGVSNLDLDNQVSKGLNSKRDSLGYMIAESTYRNRNNQQWYGKNSITSLLDRESLVPFEVTSGIDNNYGEMVQISDGTEIELGSITKMFDLTRIMISSADTKDNIYKLQILCSDNYTPTLLGEFMYKFKGNTDEVNSVTLELNKIYCNNKLWVRSKSEKDNAKINLFIGVYTYEI